MFVTQNHPSHHITKHMTKQILEILNIDTSDFDNTFINNEYSLGCDLPFSKYDVKYHDFNFNVKINNSKIKKIIKEIYNK